MVHAKFRNIASKEEGLITCEAVTFGTRLVLVSDVREIDGAVDIINFYYRLNAISFSISLADLYWIESAEQFFQGEP